VFIKRLRSEIDQEEKLAVISWQSLVKNKKLKKERRAGA
jgi:hypothetical protein